MARKKKRDLGKVRIVTKCPGQKPKTQLKSKSAVRSAYAIWDALDRGCTIQFDYAPPKKKK